MPETEFRTLAVEQGGIEAARADQCGSGNGSQPWSQINMTDSLLPSVPDRRRLGAVAGIDYDDRRPGWICVRNRLNKLNEALVDGQVASQAQTRAPPGELPESGVEPGERERQPAVSAGDGRATGNRTGKDEPADPGRPVDCERQRAHRRVAVRDHIDR
jgi:hypothetical protein